MPNFPAALILFGAPLFAFLCGIGVGRAIAHGKKVQATLLAVAGILFACGDLALMAFIASDDHPMAP